MTAVCAWAGSYWHLLLARITGREVRWSEDAIRLLRQVEADVRTAAGVERFDYTPGEDRLSMSLAFTPEPGPVGEPGA